MGRGRIVWAFPEQPLAACAYRGELLGLLSIHLILLSVNAVYPELKGMAVIYSDCLGALGRVRDLPPFRIPTRCKHSDILKMILVNCGNLTFERVYKHVAAHQDDSKAFHKLVRPAQLNCACDAGAKKHIQANTRRLALPSTISARTNLPLRRQREDNLGHGRPHLICGASAFDQRGLSFK